LVRSAGRCDLANFRPADDLPLGSRRRAYLGYHGPRRLQRYLATPHQHGHDEAFLTVIQATQNRNTLALQLKLDELILATRNANNHIAGIEEASDEEIEKAKVEVLERAG
jgi:Low affinity iron permease